MSILDKETIIKEAPSKVETWFGPNPALNSKLASLEKLKSCMDGARINIKPSKEIIGSIKDLNTLEILISLKILPLKYIKLKKRHNGPERLADIMRRRIKNS